jgi:hypothetical protein
LGSQLGVEAGQDGAGEEEPYSVGTVVNTEKNGLVRRDKTKSNKEIHVEVLGDILNGLGPC